MNQDTVIKKLQLLKSLEPQPAVFDTVKKDIYRHLGTDYHNDKNSIIDHSLYALILSLKSSRNVAYGVAFVVIFLLFIFTFSPFLQNKVNTIIMSTRIAFATNQYDKARIALGDVQYSYGSTVAINDSPSKNISQSLSLTNKELSLLKLKGEKGKYTAQQCHALYQIYLHYLEKLSNNIPENQTSAVLLKTQIFTYEELAEKKLHKYRDL